MDAFNLTVIRQHSKSDCIIGELFVNEAHLCYTLELPWRSNRQYVSCVPNDLYSAHLRYDHSDHWRIQLDGVRSRPGVQIHIGNVPKETKGCVLVGMSVGSRGLVNSATAYGLLRNAFYGSLWPVSTPDKHITVEFRGLLAQLSVD